MNTDEYITSDWKLVALRNHLRELLGIPVSHFVISFETEQGDQGVIYTTPRALRILDPTDIASRVSARMAEEGRRIIRQEAPTVKP